MKTSKIAMPTLFLSGIAWADGRGKSVPGRELIHNTPWFLCLVIVFKLLYLAIGKAKLFEIWHAYWHTFLVYGCKILQKSDNPCRKYKGFQLGLFFMCKKRSKYTRTTFYKQFMPSQKTALLHQCLPDRKELGC